MIDPKTDLGSATVAAFACVQESAAGDPVLLTAAATEDGVEVTGDAINRRDAMSCVLSITGKAKLTTAKTIAFGVKYQLSADNSNWDTAVVLQASTQAAISAAGSVEPFAVDLPLSLKGKKRWIRFNITPELDASGTDIAVWSATCILGGYPQLPAVQATETS